jgi:hypothetical protein
VPFNEKKGDVIILVALLMMSKKIAQPWKFDKGKGPPSSMRSAKRNKHP